MNGLQARGGTGYAYIGSHPITVPGYSKDYPSYGPDDASRGYILDASFWPSATDKFSRGAAFCSPVHC